VSAAVNTSESAIPRPRGDAWFLTYTGRLVLLDDPARSEICIEDIAHHLSLLCRFGGACSTFYSVAQHSVMVSWNLPQELALQGLLHDATEAYLGDVVGPLKKLMGETYKRLERDWALYIGAKFGLGSDLVQLHPLVKEVDARALATERREVTCPGPARDMVVKLRDKLPPLNEVLVPLQPLEAEALFLDRYRELTR
jgi:hypothetical protein